MIGINKTAKRVKKVNSTSKDYDYAMLPAGFLFWGEYEADVKEDGLEYSYMHRDCFLGNSADQSKDAVSAKGFVLKKLTGENTGCLKFPVSDGAEFFVAIPLEGGAIADYKISPEPFTLDGKIAKEYKLATLKEKVDQLNRQAKLEAKEKALITREA